MRYAPQILGVSENLWKLSPENMVAGQGYQSQLSGLPRAQFLIDEQECYCE